MKKLPAPDIARPAALSSRLKGSSGGDEVSGTIRIVPVAISYQFVFDLEAISGKARAGKNEGRMGRTTKKQWNLDLTPMTPATPPARRLAVPSDAPQEGSSEQRVQLGQNFGDMSCVRVRRPLHPRVGWLGGCLPQLHDYTDQEATHDRPTNLVWTK